MTHISLEAMTSYTRKTKGSIPPRLVGSTTTLYHPPPTPTHPNPAPQIFVFGGRRVSTRKVIGGMWVLDLGRGEWECLRSGEKEGEGEGEGEEGEGGVGWPGGRYFHTADIWNGHLLIFGGMGLSPSPSPPSPASVPSSPGPSSEQVELPCVLNDLHIFNCATRRWVAVPSGDSRAAAEGEREEGEGEGWQPRARYAHLAAVMRGRLVVVGGQDINNDYVTETAIYDLTTHHWISRIDIEGEYRGSYRSVAVSSPLIVQNPALSASARRDSTGREIVDTEEQDLVRLPLSEEEPGGGGGIYTFSNSNFTDVRRELQLLSLSPPPSASFTTTDLTPLFPPNTPLPPGLRFPFGALLGHHLIIAGTYLSQSVQQFAVWALDLWSWTWRRVDWGVAGEGGVGGGSWNKAVLWGKEGKLVVFGNRFSNLQEDYEHRSVNFDHIALINLEIHGIYQPPLPPRISRPGQLLSLHVLSEGHNADFDIVCEDGRSLKCSRGVLWERWGWFRQECEKFGERVKGIVREEFGGDGEGRLPRTVSLQALGELGDLPIPFSPARLTPRQLHLAEPYPVVLALLQYFYTLSLLTPLQHRPPVLSALLMLSKQYQLEDLEKLCTHAMHERLNPGTALGVYEISTLAGCVGLQVRALKMVLALQTRSKKEGSSHTHTRGPSTASQFSGTKSVGSSRQGGNLDNNGRSPPKGSIRGPSGPQGNQAKLSDSIEEDAMMEDVRVEKVVPTVAVVASDDEPVRTVSETGSSRRNSWRMSKRISWVPPVPAPEKEIPAVPVSAAMTVKVEEGRELRARKSIPVIVEVLKPPKVEVEMSHTDEDNSGDDQIGVEVEYVSSELDRTSELKRSASTQSVHHFGDAPRTTYRRAPPSQIQPPSATRSKFGDQLSPRTFVGKENWQFPLSPTTSSSHAHTLPSQSEIHTPLDSPGIKWPSTESGSSSAESNRGPQIRPSMDVIGEYTHSRDDSYGSSVGGGVSHAGHGDSPAISRSGPKLTPRAAEIPRSPRLKRPLVIDTDLAAPKFTSRMTFEQALLVDPPTPGQPHITPSEQVTPNPTSRRPSAASKVFPSWLLPPPVPEKGEAQHDNEALLGGGGEMSSDEGHSARVMKRMAKDKKVAAKVAEKAEKKAKGDAQESSKKPRKERSRRGLFVRLIDKNSEGSHAMGGGGGGNDILVN